MTGLHLLTDKPVRPTPAGAFRAVSKSVPDSVGRMLLHILQQPVTPGLSSYNVMRWTGLGEEQAALEVLSAAQADALVETVEVPEAIPDGPLEELLPPLLQTLSDSGHVLVADPDGLPIWAVGFDHETATRVAAMSGDLASLQERHEETIRALFGEATSAWAIVDGLGASRLGCWPIHVGGTRFVLVAEGLPRMHDPSFARLVWLLVHRYG